MYDIIESVNQMTGCTFDPMMIEPAPANGLENGHTSYDIMCNVGRRFQVDGPGVWLERNLDKVQSEGEVPVFFTHDQAEWSYNILENLKTISNAQPLRRSCSCSNIKIMGLNIKNANNNKCR